MAEAAFANGLGGERLEKVVGDLIVDIGTDQPSTPVAGQAIEFDFGLIAKRHAGAGFGGHERGYRHRPQRKIVGELRPDRGRADDVSLLHVSGRWQLHSEGNVLRQQTREARSGDRILPAYYFRGQKQYQSTVHCRIIGKHSPGTRGRVLGSAQAKIWIVKWDDFPCFGCI